MKLLSKVLLGVVLLAVIGCEKTIREARLDRPSDATKLASAQR